MEYKIKTYRCEWQVQLGEVDQYDRNFKPYETFSFPTRDEAVEHLKKVGINCDLAGHYGKWIPKNPLHGYCRAEIRYVEVLIEEK